MSAEARHQRVKALRQRGMSHEEIARLTGYSIEYVYKIINGNNKLGGYSRRGRTDLNTPRTPVDWNSFNPGIMSVRDSTEKIIERRSDSRYPIDPEEKHRRVLELHAQGVDCGTIAKDVGYKRNYVLKIIGGHGLLKGAL